MPGLDDLHVAEGAPGHGGVDPDRLEPLAVHVALPGQGHQQLLLQVSYVDHRLGEAGQPSVLGDQARQILHRRQLSGVQEAAQHPLTITRHLDACPLEPLPSQ
ncbi:MAG TPA: hypothetical protein VFV66_23160 [Nonomuraea sp.]|nr:hypothetical protein [Nonomuraea sp.]